ncbi:LiaF transmembrane domain-containing protein [Pseudonocardia abyssalis]|uniref:LiaF transmembrane domain-containing protein n=1 Tax=Pseudonocardia abyssalis TaxID=2792008 RepID=A0ABS6UPS5_9PSEU|nr:cell wall-active antibiotics response protein [Pseudonocardia abyssalis]MBW0118580.1 hypothetical protein [Pseudonocardia abyssalis]MBW0133799.1 hypothetical protein [Pseudonocardia abyssalis]
MQPVRVWMGIVLIGLGVVGLLGAAGVIDAGTVTARWWPLVVIGLGLAAMVAQRSPSFGPLVVTTIGVALLADVQDWPLRDLLWPALLIVVGLLVLSGPARRRSTGNEAAALAVLGGSTVRSTSAHLDHAEVSAMFGGATLDLRDAHIDRAARVDALALFGGVDVLVPPGWRIVLRGLPVFGGYEDKTRGHGPLPADAPVLTVNATAVFGGVSVTDKPAHGTTAPAPSSESADRPDAVRP